MVNGSANATENASIVTIGVQNSPSVDLMSTVPTIGPVQENETSTSVRAMKKIPIRPPLSECLSDLLTSEVGRTISNAPKNEAANTMNTMKNMMFGIQCVASQLNMSAVTASPPTILVISIIREIGTVYRSTMNSPYMAALNLPAAGVDDPLRKKDTVIGTIGNTHGVRSAANPHNIASIIRAHKEPVAAASFPSRGISKARNSGAAHVMSVQHIHVSSPFATASGEVTSMSMANLTSSKKTASPS